MRKFWLGLIFSFLILGPVMAGEFCSPFDSDQCWGVESYDNHLVWRTKGAQLALDFLFVRPENANRQPRWIATVAEGLRANVRSITDGRVVFCGNEYKGGKEWSYGNLVVVQDSTDSSYYTLYAHLESIDAALSQDCKVKQGQIIGAVGMSGSGSHQVVHLHFERLKDETNRGNWRLGIPQDLSGFRFRNYEIDFLKAYRSGIYLYLPVLSGNGFSRKTGAHSWGMAGPYAVGYSSFPAKGFKIEADDLREVKVAKINLEIKAATSRELGICVNGHQAATVRASDSWQLYKFSFDVNFLKAGLNRLEVRGDVKGCQIHNLVLTLRYDN